MGKGYIAIPDSINSKEDLEKIIKKIKISKIEQPKIKTAKAKAEGGMMNKSLKSVDKKKNPGLAKLPTDVRNKMGYMAKGGMARRDKDDAKALKGIEKQQESQAKRAQQAHKDVREYSRKKARKFKEGGMARGTGSAISGKKFQGVF